MILTRNILTTALLVMFSIINSKAQSKIVYLYEIRQKIDWLIGSLTNSTFFNGTSKLAGHKNSEDFSIKDKSIEELIDSSGSAVTNLRPAGSVEVNGERYNSVTDGGFIEKGEAVKVIRVQSQHLVVTKV